MGKSVEQRVSSDDYLIDAKNEISNVLFSNTDSPNLENIYVKFDSMRGQARVVEE